MIGYEVPDTDAVVYIGLKSFKSMNKRVLTIRLDNGKKVYEPECHWGYYDDIKKVYYSRAKKIVQVDLQEYRSETIKLLKQRKGKI